MEKLDSAVERCVEADRDLEAKEAEANKLAHQHPTKPYAVQSLQAFEDYCLELKIHDAKMEKAKEAVLKAEEKLKSVRTSVARLVPISDPDVWFRVGNYAVRIDEQKDPRSLAITTWEDVILRLKEKMYRELHVRIENNVDLKNLIR